MKETHLGELEELALLIVVGLGQDAYGVAVQKRLERKGYLRSSLGDATPQRGGRRKRMFAATADGLRELRHVRRTREHLWRLADASGSR